MKLNIPLLLILITSQNIFLYSQEERIIIKEINLTGLKRTKEDVVLQIIEPVKTGSLYTDGISDIIIQKLRETGVFVPDIKVTSEVLENDAYIHIDLRDKWTLIPIPIVAVSKGESWSAGVLAIESNLLGYYKTLGLGFFYGSQGATFLSFYVDPHFFKTELEFTAAISAGFEKIIDLDTEEATLREYESDRIGVGMGIEYPVNERFKIGISLDYDLNLLRDDSTEPFGDLNSIGLTGKLGWQDIFYDIPYERGFSMDLIPSLFRDFYSGTFYPTIESNIQWSFSPWFKHMVSLKGLAGWGNMPVQKQFRLGGMNGTRILPMNKIAAEEYASATAIYNIPLWIFKGGTISSKVFYELGYFKSDLIGRTLFHGPGIGLEFFINKLAIPAVGINLGWNLETGQMQFSAGIGM